MHICKYVGSFVIGHLSLVISHWSFVIGHWSLVICHWSLVIGHWSKFRVLIQFHFKYDTNTLVGARQCRAPTGFYMYQSFGEMV
ncbi:MAG: hypothetical protein HEQ19_13810 [Gloeotrichia echinulata CP02]